MPRHLGTFRLLLLVFGSMSLVTATTVSQSATSQIERIEISPAWAGSASTTEAVVTISNRHGIFERTWNPSTITPEFNSLRIIVDAPPDQYERLVLGNPWIRDSLKRNEGLGAWLIYVQDASMSEKAMKIFAADMHELGRDDLAQEVSDHRTEIADLSYYGNEVLLFPDHHAILWRWDPNRDLFGWSASRVKTQRCTDHPSLNVGCSAGVVAPDGQLEK
jgi:hypothetical protein